MAEQRPVGRGTKRTVLIAEDDEALAQAIAATLGLEGLEAVVTHDGEEALTLARVFQPDLVLLDVMLPGRSGVEVCATLKTDPLTASTPVVFVTAKADEIDRMIGLAAGADEYLTKPFSPTVLINLVNEVLAGRPIEPRLRRSASDLSALPTDQLVVFAQEWKELFERERKERRALEEAQQRLDGLDRLKASFLSAVTHELLTPFGSIGLALQVLQRRSEDLHPDQQDVLEDLVTEINNLHRLVNGVVKFAELVNKRREPRPKLVSLDQVIPEAVQPAAVLARARGVDFQVTVSSNLPSVFADPELLGEAVFQMAHNAIKFNLPDGQAQVQPAESGGWVVIKVSDTGVGLTPERLALLGQPFEQDADAVQRGREGLGIGWAFVRYVAEIHGGWTSVESPGLNQGSVFSLALPIVAGWHEFSVVSEADVEEEG
ncbi:MAG: response regulator [Chloroflexota bacterium]|nr:response regulator [Chloroflexota bacterium]